MSRQLVALAFFLVICFASEPARGIVDTVWVRTYPIPVCGQCTPSAVQVDAFGNVHVVGSTYGGGTSVMLKYSPDGTLLWKIDRSDETHDIVITPEGAVWACGENGITKYRSDGSTEWERSYGGSVPAMTASSDGTVYAALDLDSHITAVRLTHLGDTVWQRQYRRDSGTPIFAKAIGVAETGRVYVGGDGIAECCGWFDLFTLCYDTTGVLKWVSEYPTGDTVDDYMTHIDVDGRGRAYVTGLWGGWFPETITYDSAGFAGQQLVWPSSYGLLPRPAIDSGGCVIYTGTGWHGGTLVKDCSGPSWVRQGDFDVGSAVGADLLCNVYVAGGISGDGALLKYTPDGTLLHTWTYGKGTPSSYVATAIHVDPDGSVFLAGRGWDGAAYEIFTIRYDCSCPCHADPQCDSIMSNVQDVVKTVDVGFRGASPVFDLACPRERTDVNCDGATGVQDVVKVVNVAFRGANPATEFCEPCGP